MKVLWIVNMVMPELAEHLHVKTSPSGTWLVDISRMLAESGKADLAIACVHGREYRKIQLNGITFYLLPGTGKDMLFYRKRFEPVWRKIAKEFKPDLVHLHGTEYSHGLTFQRACPEIPAVISIQGVLNRIKDVDFGGMGWLNVLRYRTLRENMRGNGLLEMHWLHAKNARHEVEMFQRATYINGVNTWDISMAKSINPKLQAFRIEYNLRDEFYQAPKWDIAKIQRYTIFTNPSGIPLKGLHMLLKAVALLKEEFPDLRVRVPGLQSGADGKLIANSGYAKYLAALIDKLQIAEHVCFLGRQSGDQMMENMLSAHVVVVPSAIEGTSLVLREAMFLGTPCIASFRGGMADFIADKEDGFLYDYQEYPYLAQRLRELFANDSLCCSFSARAIKKAEKAHNRQQNLNDYLGMYRQLERATLSEEGK